ncbi:hypothetical protein FB451DRAFT_1182699 [Mycena latifolia]|nr:hypothetical protein FB451DRAFT_1182699 [Mycena latifolia]
MTSQSHSAQYAPNYGPTIPPMLAAALGVSCARQTASEAPLLLLRHPSATIRCLPPPILVPLLGPVVRLLLVTPRFRAPHPLVPAASNSALGRLVPGYRAPTVRLYSLHMPMHALTAASHLSTPVMTFERRTSKLVL